MATPLEKATVADLDALAAAHAVPDYPADGNKADKYEAVRAALGDDYAFEEPSLSYVELADKDVNGAQFAHPVTGEQVELAAGDRLELEERHVGRLVAEHAFLKAAS